MCTILKNAWILKMFCIEINLYFSSISPQMFKNILVYIPTPYWSFLDLLSREPQLPGSDDTLGSHLLLTGLHSLLQVPRFGPFFCHVCDVAWVQRWITGCHLQPGALLRCQQESGGKRSFRRLSLASGTITVIPGFTWCLTIVKW